MTDDQALYIEVFLSCSFIFEQQQLWTLNETSYFFSCVMPALVPNAS